MTDILSAAGDAHDAVLTNTGLDPEPGPVMLAAVVDRALGAATGDNLRRVIPRVRSAHWLPAVVALLLGTAPLCAQRAWKGSISAQASLLQGNADRRSLSTESAISHADSTFEVRGSLEFIYADASQDSSPRRVDRRAWFGAIALDYRPHDRISPFMFGNYEASYEKRILDRVSLGVGGKWVMFQPDTSTNVSVSLALLGERTRPTARSLDTASVSIMRWSGRFRIRHRFDSRVKMEHTTFYQPRATRASVYTVNSRSEFSVGLSQASSITVSYWALYDSGARGRGARRNNDGEVLLGVKREF